MRSQARRHEAGFTVIELMIVVAITGVLAAVAIPSFRSYQWKAKRSESFTNLAALAKTQKSYYAAYDRYFAAPPEPGSTRLDLPTDIARDSTAIEARFAPVGWTAEGNVFYDYDTNTSGLVPPSSGGCTCIGCFTSTAYGDVDGDTLMSAIMYVHPDGNGTECPSALGSNAAPLDAGGDPIYDMVAWHVLSDDF